MLSRPSNPKTDAIRRAILRFNVYDYLHENHIHFKVRKNGEYYTMSCFNCGKADKQFMHAANRDHYKGYFRCWVCGYKGSFFDFVAKVEHISVNQAFAKIMEISDAEYGSYQPLLQIRFINFVDKFKITLPKELRLPLDCKPLLAFKESHPAREYALQRNITDDLAKKYDLHYHPFMQRIMFPITIHGHCVGWQGRSIKSDGIPKILTSPGFQKSLTLYNIDRVRESTTTTICEGLVDAIHADRHAPVALMGKSMSEMQHKTILRFPNLKRVYIGLDPDAPKEIEAVAKRFYGTFDTYLLKIPKGKDLGDLSEEEVDYYHGNAKRFNPLEIRAI